MNTLDPEGLEKAARALAQIPEGKDWPSNEDLGGSMAGTRDDEYHDAMTEEARAAVAAYLEAQAVTTVEELEALPMETTVRCESGTIETKIPDGRWTCSSVWEPAQSSEIELPATVIYRP